MASAFRCGSGVMETSIVTMEVMSEIAVSSTVFGYNQICLCHICAREVCRITIEYTIGLENVLYKISACYIYSML